MGVDVDQAWEHQQPAGVDDVAGAFGCDVGGHGGDAVTPNRHVVTTVAIGTRVNDGATPDERVVHA